MNGAPCSQSQPDPLTSSPRGARPIVPSLLSRVFIARPHVDNPLFRINIYSAPHPPSLAPHSHSGVYPSWRGSFPFRFITFLILVVFRFFDARLQADRPGRDTSGEWATCKKLLVKLWESESELENLECNPFCILCVHAFICICDKERNFSAPPLVAATSLLDNGVPFVHYFLKIKYI